MKGPDLATRRQLARLETHEAWLALTAWLDACLRASETSCSVLEDIVDLRRRQGAAEALRFVLTRLAENREMLRRLAAD